MPICFLLGMSDNQAPSLNLKLHPRKLGDWKRSSKLAQLHWRSRPIASYKMQQGRGQLHLQQIGDNQSGEMVCLWKLGEFLARKAWLSSGWCQQSVKHRQKMRREQEPTSMRRGRLSLKRSELMLRSADKFTFGPSMPTWIRDVIVNPHSAFLKASCKSVALAWVKNSESKYWVMTVFPLQYRICTSICPRCDTLFKDSSKHATKKVTYQFLPEVVFEIQVKSHAL